MQGHAGSIIGKHMAVNAAVEGVSPRRCTVCSTKEKETIIEDKTEETWERKGRMAPEWMEMEMKRPKPH
jgi:hypothetical protein